MCLQALVESLDFIIDTASGNHPFDPYMFLLKTCGVLVLVGAPSEIKIKPRKPYWWDEKHFRKCYRRHERYPRDD
ncbi:probable cinnamyl alcohol dehydrogenase 1 [Arachis hypogaea]|uniref:probable cinnamyl alcohol dehydrogenase 1 n=1 Tax=Arachis hypogaea TaxID=3818 RepID=UPI003B20ECBC